MVATLLKGCFSNYEDFCLTLLLLKCLVISVLFFATAVVVVIVVVFSVFVAIDVFLLLFCWNFTAFLFGNEILLLGHK